MHPSGGFGHTNFGSNPPPKDARHLGIGPVVNPVSSRFHFSVATTLPTTAGRARIDRQRVDVRAAYTS